MPSLPGSVDAALPPAPPLGGPRPHTGQELAIVPVRDGVLALPPGADATASPTSAALARSWRGSQSADAAAASNAQIVRRVAQLYTERGIEEPRRPAWDDRIRIEPRVPERVAQLANVIAHAAAALYWTVATVLTVAYALYFGPRMAARWTYACLCGWAFTWLVLEVVKVALSAIQELSQLSERRRLAGDRPLLKEAVRRARERKRKLMEGARHDRGALDAGADPLPQLHALMPRPPLPPEPPPALSDEDDEPIPTLPGALPALGDASAG